MSFICPINICELFILQALGIKQIKNDDIFKKLESHRLKDWEPFQQSIAIWPADASRFQEIAPGNFFAQFIVYFVINRKVHLNIKRNYF